MTAISSYVSIGYSVTGLRQAEGESRTPSSCAVARSLALSVVSTAAPFWDSETFLAAVAITMSPPSRPRVWTLLVMLIPGIELPPSVLVEE